MLPTQNEALVAGWSDVLGKNCPFFSKSSQKKSPSQKNAKISLGKLKFKVQNIYIKPVLKPLNTYNKKCFEHAYLCENVIDLLEQKIAQNVAISLGYFTFSINHNEPQKVAQLAKSPIWTSWLQAKINLSFLSKFKTKLCNFQGFRFQK